MVQSDLSGCMPLFADHVKDKRLQQVRIICLPKASSTAASLVAADTMRSEGSGHHATATAGPDSCHSRVQRPVATSHTRTVESRDEDASHCPLLCTATAVTCATPTFAVATYKNPLKHKATIFNLSAQILEHETLARNRLSETMKLP